MDEQDQDNGISSSLSHVTPLSKYLTMALFIVLPFLGGWIGYMYAPVQIVEIEKPISTSNSTPFSADSQQSIVQTSNEMIIDPKTVKIGDRFDNLTVSKVRYETLPGNAETFMISFDGTTTVTGLLTRNEHFGPQISLTDEHRNDLPSFIETNPSGPTYKDKFIVVLGPDNLLDVLPNDLPLSYSTSTNDTYVITAEIKDYLFQVAPKETAPTAELVKIIKLEKISRNSL